MNTERRQPSPGLIAAAVAVACIGNLVFLTAFGIFETLPKWCGVLIVVAELLAPFIIYRVLKRRQQG